MKTKIIIWSIVLLVLFTIFFIWLLNHAFVILTLSTVFKTAGVFAFGIFISYWIGYWVCHHKMNKKVETETLNK